MIHVINLVLSAIMPCLELVAIIAVIKSEDIHIKQSVKIFLKTWGKNEKFK